MRRTLWEVASEPIIQLDDLSHGETSHTFIGVDHGVPVSMFLVHTPPGRCPGRHTPAEMDTEWLEGSRGAPATA